MHTTLVRNSAVLFFLGLIFFVFLKVQDYKVMPEDQQTDGIIVLILYFIITAVVGGFLFITYILPIFGDAVGEAMLSSAEESGTDPYMKARGKVAIGDYSGAVAEFREIAKDNPDDRMPVVEMVKLYLERLHDPNNAELTLENAIRQEHWGPDDAPYFIFRLIDLIQEHQPDDKDRVVNLLQKVMRRYPGTRHSANAIHRLRDIDPALVVSTQAEIAAEQAKADEEKSGVSHSADPAPNVPNPSAGPPDPNV